MRLIEYSRLSAARRPGGRIRAKFDPARQYRLRHRPCGTSAREDGRARCSSDRGWQDLGLL